MVECEGEGLRQTEATCIYRSSNRKAEQGSAAVDAGGGHSFISLLSFVIFDNDAEPSDQG